MLYFILTRQDWTMVIAVLGLLLSTGNIVFQIWKTYLERNGRIMLGIGFTIHISPGQNPSTIGDEQYVCVSITNISDRKRTIERLLQRAVKNKSSERPLLSTEKFSFPKSLEPGEKINYSIPLSVVERAFTKYNKIEVVVEDTYKKRFISRSFKINEQDKS